MKRKGTGRLTGFFRNFFTGVIVVPLHERE
jgi:hypothetical protein